MSELFLYVLNMSLTGSYAIIFVILVRLLLKKAPKVISYALWSVVAFRLLIPFSVESIFSLIPRKTNVMQIPREIIYQQSPQLNSGVGAVDSLVGQSLPAPTAGASVNPWQIYAETGAYIWVLGIAALLIYSLVSILLLKRQLKNAQLIEQNIFEADNLQTPFVLGLINPKIYLPAGLNAMERSYILLHEQTHINRKDHIIKIIAFLVLAIHWFNPLVWLAFKLLGTDMELSCDERVLKRTTTDIKKSYADSLLSLASGRYILNGSPLAFGEGDVRGRIKNVLNYKKPTFWVLAVAIILAVVVAVGLFTNPITAKPDDNSLAAQLLNNKTEYVGDNSKVGAIISLLTFPENIEYDSFALLTESEPFGITVNLKTDTETKELYSDEANQQQFRNNAAIMFALIGNVEYIDFNLDDGLTPYAVHYTREEVNRQYGKDVRDFAKSKEEFSKLINGLALGESSDSQADINARKNESEAPDGNQEIMLPDYEYDGQDPIEKLVYDVEVEKVSETKRGGFVIVAPQIFGSYEEEDLLKVFVTTYSAVYNLYGFTLSQETGGIIPAAITYRKADNGGYVLEKYEPAKDGSLWEPSIREYCTLPVSQKKIKGLADKIIRHYADYENIRVLMSDNLYKHLRKNGIKYATLTNSQGEIEFSMSDPKYQP
jgi:beta-lactamase regulating signal transducer with metallopeptidase domain